jgi:hypothetical protein
MSAGRRYFSVESWLRKANADESAECATVGPAASVGNAVNPAIDMTDSNTVEDVSIVETDSSVGLVAPISDQTERSETLTLYTAQDESVCELTSIGDSEVPKPMKKKLKVSTSNSRGSYVNHTWISKTASGYVCKVCQEFGIKGLHDKGHGRGTWVSVPLPLNHSRKLAGKAAKHENSAAHQAAVAASRLVCRPGPLAQLVTAANEPAVQDEDAMKPLFRSVYFMFSSEIAHTTHWRELVSTVADSDSSGRLKQFLTGCPASAHHLSSFTFCNIDIGCFWRSNSIISERQSGICQELCCNGR